MLSRPLLFLAAVTLTSGSLNAAEAGFVGKWKVNIAKSTITGFQAKIESAGDKKLDFRFGDDVDTYVFDGKEHPTKYGSVRVCTQPAPDHWKCVVTRQGKVTATLDFIVVDGGKALNQSTAGTHADGSTYKEVNTYKRVAGASGLVGTWETTKVDPKSYPDWTIEPFAKDGLAFVTPSAKLRTAIKFDGKDYPDKGPRVPPGATTAGKRIDARTLELTSKRKGKVVEMDRLVLSPDGKMFTLTASYPGVKKKEIDVYERQ